MQHFLNVYYRITNISLSGHALKAVCFSEEIYSIQLLFFLLLRSLFRLFSILSSSLSFYFSSVSDSKLFSYCDLTLTASYYSDSSDGPSPALTTLSFFDSSELLISSLENCYIFYVNFIEFSSRRIHGASGFFSIDYRSISRNIFISNFGLISGGSTFGKGMLNLSLIVKLLANLILISFKDLDILFFCENISKFFASVFLFFNAFSNYIQRLYVLDSSSILHCSRALMAAACSESIR